MSVEEFLGGVRVLQPSVKNLRDPPLWMFLTPFLSIKKWGKIKTGYGWIYGKKTKYICRLETKAREAPEFSTQGNRVIPVQPALVGIKGENVLFESDSEGLVQPK